MEWGNNRGFGEKIKLLCKAGTNDTIIVWIVGRISNTWFSEMDGKPASQVKIYIVPLSEKTGLRARRSIVSLCKPPGSK